MAANPECPNNAIYEGGAEWRLSDGTNLHGPKTTPMGNSYDADALHPRRRRWTYHQYGQMHGMHRLP